MNVYVYLRSKLNWEVVQQNKMNVYTKRIYFLSPWVIFFLFDFLKNVCKQTDANQSPEEMLAVYVSAKPQISLNIFLGSVLSFLCSHNAVLILVLGTKKNTWLWLGKDHAFSLPHRNTPQRLKNMKCRRRLPEKSSVFMLQSVKTRSGTGVINM